MDSEPPIVRIVILQPADGSALEADAATRLAAPASAASARRAETLSALNRIGAEVAFTVVSDVEGCREEGSKEDVDLVVLDRCDTQLCVRALGGLAQATAPVVAVISEEADDDAALAAFRHGASDCVRAGDDYAEVLPVVALEQIRRWRQLREQTSSRRKIEWLERLQEAIISEIPVSLVVVDGDFRIVEVNPEFSRVFAVSGKKAKGAHLEEVLPPDLLDSSNLLELISSVVSTRWRAPRLGQSVGPGGESRLFDVRGQRLDEEGRVLLVFSDVSETEILSRRLGELERYNENIILNINSALLVVDRGGLITFANPRAGEILRVERDALISRPIADWFGIDGEPRSLIKRTLEDGARFKGAETMITLDDGTVLPIGMSCAPRLDDDGGVRGAVAIFQDLSEIKQLQRQVMQTEKMASIGQLAAGVAHEINNPMGFIHANLYQMHEYLNDLQGYWDGVANLQQAVAAGDLESARQASGALGSLSRDIDIDFVRADFSKAVRESQEGSERIRHIVRDLRDFSHQGSAERMLADVNQCVDSTASIVYTMMKHSVVLEKEYQDLPQLYCYPMQLKQVFMNLLVNAYQAIEESIGESTGTGVIRISTRRRGEGVTVSIEDTGVGIPKENLDRIFDPFFTTKEVGMGMGLGLSTTYGIIQRHGGTMTVSSETGRGSSFEIWLPERYESDLPAESGEG